MTKTQIAILWGLAVLVVIVFAVLGRITSRSQPESVSVTAPPARVHHLPDIPQSAKKLYVWADQAARTWKGDAELVSTATSWPFARVEDLSKPVDWTFQFFSPSTQHLYAVTVRDTQATPFREGLSPYSLPTISIEDWQIDSHQALGIWLDYGGAMFLTSHSVVDISARLRYSEQERLVWIVAGLVRGSQTVYVVAVDAQSGEVVE